MKVIESRLLSKKNKPDGGEDRLFISADFIAVVDGATSKGNHLFDGKTGGAFVADSVVEALQVLPADLSALKAFEAINQTVLKNLKAAGYTLSKKTADRPCASACVYSKHHQQIWRLGDCNFRAGSTINYGRKLIDEINASTRSAMIHALLMGPETEASIKKEDKGREVIMPLLKWQSVFMNNKAAGPYAYGAIDGSTEASQFVEVFDASTAHEIVLSSDGYNDISQDLKHAEAKLKKLIKEDPLFIRHHMQTKGLMAGNISFDDRVYVRFSLTD